MLTLIMAGLLAYALGYVLYKAALYGIAIVYVMCTKREEIRALYELGRKEE